MACPMTPPSPILVSAIIPTTTGARATGQGILDVLIPHYRDPEGLALALDSVAGQDWLAGGTNRLRVIVVDDGSPELDLAAARAACEAFARTSGQAVLFDALPVNQGRPAARNRLLDLAGAPYLAWLDAGDIWYPPKLSVQFAHIAALEVRGADPARLWVSCAYDWDQGGRRRTLRQQVAGDQLGAMLIGDNLRAYLWTLLGRAEAFRIAGRFDARLLRLQDLDYFLTFLRAGGEIVVPPETDPLCCYFKSDIGRDAVQVAAGYQLILAKSAPVIHFYPRAFRQALAHKAWMLPARFARSNGDWRAEAGYLARAALANPGLSLRLAVHQARRRLSALKGWIRARVRGQRGAT